MKNNTLLIWNIALTLLVAFLLVKQLSGPKPAAEAQGMEQAAADKPLRVVYVNADTLLEKFTDFKTQQDAMAAKEKNIDSQLKARGAALEKEFAAAQQKIQQGLMTPNQVAQEEQRLMGKQQKLMEDQERMTKEFLAESDELNKQFEERIKGVLKSVRDEMGYDYILSYGPGTGVLMVNDSLDVTDLVLQKLNAEEK